MQNKNAYDVINDIQYEYEAFNYQELERSTQLSKLETSLALMMGCNGILYNNDIFNDRESTVKMLRKYKDKWNSLTYINSDCKNAGVFCNNQQVARLLNEISIPVTAYLENACCAVITGSLWNDFSNEQIKKILEKMCLPTVWVLRFSSPKALKITVAAK